MPDGWSASKLVIKEMESNLSFAARFVAVCDNASDSSVTREVWEIQDKNVGIVAASFLLLLAVIGLPWNLLVFVTILVKKLYKHPTTLLLLNLVLVDLLWIIFVIPSYAATGLAGEFGIPGLSDRARCESCHAGVGSVVLLFVSLYTVCYMAFDRFLFIYKPLKYSKVVTSVRTLIVLMVTWIASLIVAFTPLLTDSINIVFSRSLLTCQAFLNSFAPYSITVFVMAGIAVTLIVVFDVWVIVIVLKNIKAIYTIRRSMKGKDSKSHHRSASTKQIRRKRSDKRLHLCRLFGGLLCCNLIAWLPAIVTGLVVVITGDRIEISPSAFYTFLQVIFLTQVVTHPFVETIMIQEVRDPIKKAIFCSCIWKKSNPECCGCLGDGACTLSRMECGCVSLLHTALLHHHPHEAETSHVGEISDVDGSGEGRGHLRTDAQDNGEVITLQEKEV